MSASASLQRTAYRDLVAYTVDQDPVAIDLRDNTNLWGVPPAAARAIADAAAMVSRYPRNYASALLDALADYLAVDPKMVVTGCGSDDVIDASFRALADPGDHVAFLSPSFSTAVTFARMNALSPETYRITSDWEATTDCLLASDARLIYLCSPNNPTGGVVPRRAIERLVDEVRGVLILDEAYAEYAGASACNLVGRSGRLLVVRTLSKAFGLAGLRVGYGIGCPALIAEVEKARGPYKVNAVAERAALAALNADRLWVQGRVRETIVNRERLADALKQLGLTPLTSEANFLCCPTTNATTLARRLASRGVGVRVFTGLPTFGDAIRVTVGPWPLMQALLDALRDVLEIDAADAEEGGPCG